MKSGTLWKSSGRVMANTASAIECLKIENMLSLKGPIGLINASLLKSIAPYHSSATPFLRESFHLTADLDMVIEVETTRLPSKNESVTRDLLGKIDAKQLSKKTTGL